MNYEILILAILIVIAFRNVGDWIIYNLRSAPKMAAVSPYGWLLGFICLIGIVYFFLNNNSFWS